MFLEENIVCDLLRVMSDYFLEGEEILTGIPIKSIKNGDKQVLVKNNVVNEPWIYASGILKLISQE